MQPVYHLAARQINHRFVNSNDKRDPRLLHVFALVMREYDAGRVTSLADEEVLALAEKAFA